VTESARGLDPNTPEGTESFQWALIRVVPRVERGEAINVGVIVYSKRLRYLAARIELDEARLRGDATPAIADTRADLALGSASAPVGTPLCGQSQ